MRWLAWSLALSMMLVLSVHQIASAHASLLASEPAAGTTLAISPARVRLLFSEPMEPTLATISLIDAAGVATPLAVTGDPHDVHALIAAVPSHGTGEFRVVWHVISADGHPVGGSFLFAVGVAGAPPPTPAGPAPAVTWGPELLGAPLVPALLRGLGVGMLMAEAGLLFFTLRFGGSFDSRPVRVARIASVAAPVFLVGHFTAWLLNASPNHQLTAAWLSSIVGSTVGRMELWRTLLSLLPLWALALARRPTLALILTVPALCMSAAVGHAAAMHPAFSIPLKIVHLLAIALWLGGLLWLLTRPRNDSGTTGSEALTVSAAALVAIIAVIVSGVAQTLLIVPLHNLVSAYGAIVAAKVAGLCVLIAFGAHHRFRVLPRIVDASGGEHAATDFRLSLRREIAVLWIVILLGGFLAYVPPPAATGTSSIPANRQGMQ